MREEKKSKMAHVDKKLIETFKGETFLFSPPSSSSYMQFPYDFFFSFYAYKYQIYKEAACFRCMNLSCMTAYRKRTHSSTVIVVAVVNIAKVTRHSS